MTIRPLAYVLILIATPTHASAQGAASLPIGRRAEAVDQTLSSGLVEFSERVEVDECSVLKLLDGDTSALRNIRYLRYPEAWNPRSPGLRCKPGKREGASPGEVPARWLVFDSIVSTGDTVTVRTRRYWPEYVRSETFSMEWSGSTYRVLQIVLRPSLHGSRQPLIPPRKPPV